MGERCTAEKRHEALQFTDEIGVAMAVRGLGLTRGRCPSDTAEGKNVMQHRLPPLAGRSEADLLAKNTKLRAQIKQS